MPVKFRIHSIKGLVAAAAALLCAVIGLLGLLTYAVTHEEIESEIEQRVEAETKALLAYHRAYGLAALAEVVRVRDGAPSARNGVRVASVGDTDRTLGHIITDASGRRLVDTLGLKMPPPGSSEFLRFRKPGGEIGVAQALSSPLPGGGRLVVAGDSAGVNNMDLAILELFSAAFTVILAVGGIVIIGLGSVLRRRLNQIETDAVAIIKGDMSHRIALDGSGGEFDRLAVILNRMLDIIGELVANLRQVSSDIAHDLRLPLTRLRRSLELAEEAQGDTVRTHVIEAGEAADDLLELFSAILAISEIEGQAARKRFTWVAVHEAVREITDAYSPAFASADKTLTVDLAPATVFGERRLLQQGVANLLDNALAHTPPGTCVGIKLFTRGDIALLHVADDGPGVPDVDHDRIFERLTRLDASRSGSGHGLGLNMVKAITQAHSGRVGVVGSTDGLTIEIQLPIAGEAESDSAVYA